MKRGSMALRIKLIYGLLLLCGPGHQIAYGQHAYELEVSKYLMGTLVDVSAVHTNVNECKQALYLAFREAERVEALLSAQRDTSEISLLNTQAGRAPRRISPETFAILERAAAYARRYDEVFTICIGPLSELWGFSDDEQPRVPAKDSIAALLPLVAMRHLQLNQSDTSAFLARQGMRLDLGGIAKGYAIDRMTAVLRAQGLRDFFVNAGGDIYASGRKSADRAWTVGIKHPRRTEQLVATLSLQDFAIATSGDYERAFVEQGKRYHHILDPSSGYPAADSQSASVLAASAEEADVLATVLFIRGVLGIAALKYNYVHVDADGALHYDSLLVETNRLRLFR